MLIQKATNNPSHQNAKNLDFEEKKVESKGKKHIHFIASGTFSYVYFFIENTHFILRKNAELELLEIF